MPKKNHNNHDLTTLHGRLRYAREESGLTMTELSERTGISINAVKKHLAANGNQFDEDQAKRYGRATGFEWPWLLHSLGEPGKSALTQTRTQSRARSNKSSQSLVSIREVDVSAGAGGGGEMPAAYKRAKDGSTLLTDAVIAEVMFPEAWLVSMGLDPNQTDLVRVRGDSMSPEIEDGDWVFVDRRVQKLVADDIYLIFDGFGIVVKSLAIVRASRGQHPRVRILSANTKYPAEEVPAADVFIIGRVHYRIGRIVRGRQ